MAIRPAPPDTARRRSARSPFSVFSWRYCRQSRPPPASLASRRAGRRNPPSPAQRDGVVVGDGQRVLRHDHQHQQEDGKAQQQLGGPSQPLVVDAGHDHHGKQPQHRKDQLAFEVVCPVAGLIIGRGEAGGKHHHQPHAGEQQRQKQEGKIHGSHEDCAPAAWCAAAVPAGAGLLPAFRLLSLAAALGLPGGVCRRRGGVPYWA